MTCDTDDIITDGHRRQRATDAIASANRLLDRARRAEWSGHFRAMFTRLAALAPLMWQHKKRGTLYALVGIAKVQTATPIKEGDALTIYMGQDGALHARLTAEFDDSRFAFVPGPGQPSREIASSEGPTFREIFGIKR